MIDPNLNPAFSRNWEGALPIVCQEAGISVKGHFGHGTWEAYDNQTGQALARATSKNDAIAAAFLIACDMQNLNPADYGYTFA